MSSGRLNSALEQLARRSLASPGRTPRQFLARARVRRLRRSLGEIYSSVQRRLAGSSVASRAEEWLLDNRHVIEDALETLDQQLPDRYLGQLPGTGLNQGRGPGNLRIESLARLLLKTGQLPLDTSWLEDQVDCFQDISELSIGELWALPGMLALCILEQLMDKANLALTQLDGSVSSGKAGQEGAVTSSIAGLIISLRLVGAHDWHRFFERVSRVERFLRQDPAHTYAQMEFDSRNRYRSAIERLARGSHWSESRIAHAAVRLARAAVSEDSRQRHVGYYLVSGGLVRLEQEVGFKPTLTQFFGRLTDRNPNRIYFGTLAMLILLPLLCLAWGMAWSNFSPGTIALAMGLAALPASGLAMALLNGLLSWLIPPRPLARMDYESGLPDSAGSVVVVPILLADESDVSQAFEQLETNFLGNRDPGLIHAILGDFADADQAETITDSLILQRAERCLEALERRYGQGRFLFLNRKRHYNSSEQRWMGWERKRGKLVEFNRLLGGAEDTSYDTLLGDLDSLRSVRYVITLDADTRLPPGVAVRLVGTIDHPLSRAVLDHANGGLKAGYSIIQPRLDVDPEHGADTPFIRIFSGDRTVDLYTHASSDVYHDLFGQGIFTGKGIYDWRAIEHCLDGVIPDNSVLSHDLLEGVHSRVGLATDLVLFEQFPSSTAAFMRRLHRWVRGDWQLLPWLGRRVKRADGHRVSNRLSLIDRWKIVDNLRRSLLPPTLLLLLLMAWLGWLPGSPLAATILIATFSAAPLLSELLGLLTRMLAQPRFAPLTAINALPDLKRQGLHWLTSLMLLPYQSAVLLDAISRTLVRMCLTRRRLLQWTTAAQTHKRVGQGSPLGRLLREMWLSPLVAMVTAAVLIAFRPDTLLLAMPFLLGWIFAPGLSWLLDRATGPVSPQLRPEQHDLLRTAGRRTWLFFEHFMTPENHWLPPDNFQEEPRVALARRTSPTNIGMGLNAALAAHDFGWIDIRVLVAFLQNCTERMQDLERHRGHWLNWYETENLRPLLPRYVSTVDSGNLAAALIVMARAMDELAQKPIRIEPLMQGLRDTLAVIEETLAALPPGDSSDQVLPPLLDWLKQRRLALSGQDDQQCYRALLAFQRHCLNEVKQRILDLAENQDIVLSKESLFQLRVWLKELDQQCHRISDLTERLLPWLPAWSELGPEDLAALEQMPSWCSLKELLIDFWSPARAQAIMDTARAAIQQLSSAPVSAAAVRFLNALPMMLENAARAAEQLDQGLSNLRARADLWVEEMDFRFLYDSDRELFHIGYDLESGSNDANHYDLLASEARLASLVAIAKGDVPLRHWLHMGRPYRRRAGRAILMSWGATMFEYLMPELYARHPRGSLLDHASRAAIRLHRQFSDQQGVPWGISESGYYQLDEQMHYQYRSFGVPRLGFRRDLGDRLVIAPYASLMALRREPEAVLENLERLRQARALGLYGFHEAVDYGRREKLTAHRPRVVRSWMSHHQGMGLLAITNFLHGDVMVRRFHADRRISSSTMLLYERKPLMPPRLRASRQPRIGPPVQIAPRPELWSASADTDQPSATWLSNGQFSAVATAQGASGAVWNGIMLTRWQADRSASASAHRMLIRDLDSGQQLNLGEPATTAAAQEASAAWLGPHRAEFQRHGLDLNCRMKIAVSSQHDIQVHQLRLSNESGQPRRLILVSHAEVAMATPGEFERHPAFARLFIESEFLPGRNTLLFRKRPRSEDERPIYLAHQLVQTSGANHPVGWDSDRSSFLGRGRVLDNAVGLDHGVGGMAGRSGAVIDPAIALGVEIELPPYGDIELAFLTGASHSRRELLASLDFYASMSRIDWLFEHAAMQSAQEAHMLRVKPQDIPHAMAMLSACLWPEPANRQLDGPLPDQPLQLLLFSRGISGDWPIILVRVHDDHEPAPLERLIKLHTYLCGRQFHSDLVLIDESAGGYGQPSRDYLQARIDEIRSRLFRSLSGRVHLISGRELGRDQRLALARVACLVLDARSGQMAWTGRQLDSPMLPPLVTSRQAAWTTQPLPKLEGLMFDNGIGAFDPNQRAYVIELAPGSQSPAPWSNVLANRDFGTLISSNGSMCTWRGNSSENRISPWANDPITEPSGEVLYLRDEETGEVWNPTPGPIGASGPCRVTHGLGWTRFEQVSRELEQTLRVHVDDNQSIKICQLSLSNRSAWTRRITASYYLEWVLGTARLDHAQHLLIDTDRDLSAILARNPFSPRAGAACAFVASSEPWHGFTTCRREFLGKAGSIRAPAALQRIGLAGQAAQGLDPCGVIQLHLDIPPGQTRSVSFLIGQGNDAAQARAMIQHFQKQQAIEQSFRHSEQSIRQLLSAVEVRTPEPAMNLMLNQWLPYQTLMGRLWGRTGYYQSSGAFGFRDQLQDMLAMLWFDPAMVREHLLLAASRQFIDGDVLHWWHEAPLRGVRTRCSDDLLWLPYAVAHYVRCTGDVAVLSESVRYLDGAPLLAEESERYAEYGQSEREESLYEHCKRAIDRSSTVGPHGLPTIGNGDWNDGFNRVSVSGRGESVWLAWFLIRVLKDFAGCCDHQGEPGCAGQYRQWSEELERQVDRVAWDGDWYQRAYFDDGSPLGSHLNDECQIDLIAQAWSVLAPDQPTSRASRAMASVMNRLVDADQRLIKLLTPAFDSGARSPGYIKAYPPGVRENGAQYTHAATWAVWAMARLGQGDEAMSLFRLLNPILRTQDQKQALHYRLEPYVLAGDIYSQGELSGRGGWSWYTGAAAWLYRAGLEALLGLRQFDQEIELRPCLPTEWSECQIRLRRGAASYVIDITQHDDPNRPDIELQLDGQTLPGRRFAFIDDAQRHQISFRIRKRSSPDHSNDE
jgi:cyclic beta-1,2-glucan synthetase